MASPYFIFIEPGMDHYVSASLETKNGPDFIDLHVVDACITARVMQAFTQYSGL
jgi:hypothetical protein